MRDVAKLTPDQLKRRQSFLEHGFEMFSSRSIEAVYLPDVAKASGHGIATLYRYFSTKAEFALAIAEWKWGEFFRENRKRSPIHNLEDKTAADMLDFYLESFLELYRKHKALLRFNQLFNIYIRAENIDTGTVDAYRGLMQPIVEYFPCDVRKGKAGRHRPHRCFGNGNALHHHPSDAGGGDALRGGAGVSAGGRL